jgi:putative endonuclease
MYTVYILYSEKDRGLYVGCTSNIEERFKRHTNGQVLATMNRRPVVCIHTEEFLLKSEAFNRERFLKTLWSARFK